MKRQAEYLLTRAPLPMLALAASYGVWSFNLLFVPGWVAFVSAAAFELTYVALAFTPTSDPKRAVHVSIAAVVVSVLYNVLASLFVRQPGLLVDTPLWGDVALAVLHGAPLAIVAYHVAGLLLHRDAVSDPLVASLQAQLAETQHALTLSEQRYTVAVQIVNQLPQGVAGVDTKREQVRALVDSGVSVSSAARQAGVARSTAHKYVKEG